MKQSRLKLKHIYLNLNKNPSIPNIESPIHYKKTHQNLQHQIILPRPTNKSITKTKTKPKDKTTLILMTKNNKPSQLIPFIDEELTKLWQHLFVRIDFKTTFTSLLCIANIFNKLYN